MNGLAGGETLNDHPEIDQEANHQKPEAKRPKKAQGGTQKGCQEEDVEQVQ
jgi:hypothetical protein